MNNNIDTLRKKLNLPVGGKNKNVSKIRTKVKYTINQDTNLSWRDRRKLRVAIKNALEEELPDIIDVTKELSEQKVEKKKQKIEQRIKKPTNTTMQSIGLLAGGLALGGFALAAQNMMPRQVTPLPLTPATPFDGPYMSMFPPMQLNNNIHNQADRNISAVTSRVLNSAMAISGLCLAEAMRPKTSEELEQKEQARVKSLNNKIANLDNNNKTYDDIKNDTAYKNLLISQEANRFFNTANIDSIQNDDNFTIESENDFETKIQKIITSNDETEDKAGVKALYQEFEKLSKIQEIHPESADIQKHFIEKLFKKILYNKLRDSFISEDAVEDGSKQATGQAFDRLMKNNYLKTIYLDTLLSSDSQEQIDKNINSIIKDKMSAISIGDLSAENILGLVASIDIDKFHKDNKETAKAIVKLLALNHANNLLNKKDSTYHIIKDSRHLL